MSFAGAATASSIEAADVIMRASSLCLAGSDKGNSGLQDCSAMIP